MEKKELIEKLNNLFAVEDVVSKDELLAEKVLEVIDQELSKAREEGKIEVLTEIFQTCYQEDSKTRELVEEKLAKLKDNK